MADNSSFPCQSSNSANWVASPIAPLMDVTEGHEWPDLRVLNFRQIKTLTNFTCVSAKVLYQPTNSNLLFLTKVVAYRRSKTTENTKRSASKVVAVAYERWSLTGGGHSGRFHCTYMCIYYYISGTDLIIRESNQCFLK